MLQTVTNLLSRDVDRASCAPETDLPLSRPSVSGKFLFVGQDKLWIRGVTYGAFCPNKDGNEYHDLDVIERDFAQMAANSVNTVRIPHTMPPRELLDKAAEHGIHVMVGLSAEQYVGYLIDKRGAPDIEGIVRDKVRACAEHPAILCYAIGNEIAAPLVRWLGRRQVERYLERLYWAIKAEDPEGLVTYVNYPTTEYLQLPFLDLVCFNVYLESRDRFALYLERLQNVAGDRPLIMSEVGLDSLRHGEDVQAEVLDWQIHTTYEAGCAGTFIFAWTDEWYRAGAEVDDWAFGLTRRDRSPKPALTAVSEAFSQVPFPKDLSWPRISVVVCTYNGARTLRDCFDGLLRLAYPNYEVIVVNDGSSDATAEITKAYGFRLISTENRGLGSARNTGLQAAAGEIVAYIDDDAFPDPHWLHYLAVTFLNTEYVGVGGPNIPPPGDGPIADCVAHAPGGPVHVLLSDREAEHIPGCNMAFRKNALMTIGGFDPRFRIAGDDVDVCWQLQQQGWKLAFNPAAVVWHHRRNSVRAYWKQQLNYGKAEAILERKWPQKYNGAGHFSWAGRVYCKSLRYILGQKWRVYHGLWGSAPFQSLYASEVGSLWSLFRMPEWYLLIAACAMLSALGFFWRPLLFGFIFVIGGVGITLLQANLSTVRAMPGEQRGRIARLQFHLLTTCLHLLQPLARLSGRVREGLTPWRRTALVLSIPWQRTSAVWTENWREPTERCETLAAALQTTGVPVSRGGDFDAWDLEVGSGLLGAARLLMAVEDHGAGRQLVRCRLWPRLKTRGLILSFFLTSLAVGAAVDHAWIASIFLGSSAILFSLYMLMECSSSMRAIVRILQQDAGEAL